MFKRKTQQIIVGIAVVLGGSLGFLWLPFVWKHFSFTQDEWFTYDIINSLIGAFIAFIVALILSKQILRTISSIEKYLNNKSPLFLLFGSIGMIVGLVIGTLLSSIFNYIYIPIISNILPVVLIALCGYLGFSVGTRRPDTWKKVIQQLKPKQIETEMLERREHEGRKYKILDTSVIIDGRIYDIAKTGFIEGILLVPLFVVHELQLIADSSDGLKRAKGRRGLDILSQLQKLEITHVEIYEGDFEEIVEVDSKLVKLAKVLDGFVMTNDYNLNKVCTLQNVPVLNINELANAIKPVVLPGETMDVLIVKDGTERQQGVAYLDDGTMIVVEDGHYYMNQTIEVVITSALQTAAGRMIFAKPTHTQRKIKEKV
ncbi:MULTISPECIES: PIN/TRAM domain-containing protein [unclassified Granulicatella]|uniref:PIN/TRAM domain-containing protein n=1 Tax=unclassified Granulicatella TaxID=2630493 RepID=UPI00107390B5|nr:MULTISPECIES: PIN/TRAM domain-containing protein [unclassified Granulicatella]MBF0780452.1 PIN/TRAM domain-containing protein [Granulicatella sp. 19428wC4_WM01]TFU95396.1 PIN/TRAM domain-containing protein [Granulicatella sp. WM01]